MTGTGADPRLIDAARALDKRAVAELVAIFEDSRPAARATRAAVLDALGPRVGVVLGITGTPGSGKSSLVARVVPEMLRGDPALSVGVVAVDPSSHISGGALLGDRTRVRFAPDERRTFFRSQASATELGGLAPTTYQVVRLISALFDVVIVETVGIGQSELDVRHLADHVVLVMQPLAGDEIQFLKAGIIEIPDRFVINKCDDPAASTALRQLTSSLTLARPFDDERPPIHLTSARTGDGVPELCAALSEVVDAGAHVDAGRRDDFFFGRWVADEWGRVGTAYLRDTGGPGAWRRTTPSGVVDIDGAAAAFDESCRAALSRTKGQIA